MFHCGLKVLYIFIYINFIAGLKGNKISRFKAQEDHLGRREVQRECSPNIQEGEENLFVAIYIGQDFKANSATAWHIMHQKLSWLVGPQVTGKAR